MSIYGRQEVMYFQLTSVGAERVQTGNYPGRLSIASRQVMRDIAKLGGTVELDELKMMTGANPQAAGVALRRLVDLGYVTPVTFGTPTR